MNSRSIMMLTLMFSILIPLSGCFDDSDNQLNSSITSVDDNGVTTINAGELMSQIDGLAIESLSVDEQSGLVYMREEEKLAHDVYVNLFNTWNDNVFNNISTAEQTHTDSILILLDRYSITDPVGNNVLGVFTNSDLQSLYDALVLSGSSSLINALMVGTEIEEIDIIDLQEQLNNTVDNEDITLVYNNLIKGSRNHLRAFVKNLDAQGITYTPSHLTQIEYDSIINSSIETGGS